MWGTGKWGLARWGVEAAPIMVAGGWNKDWAEKYGPESEKKEKLKQATIKRAIKVIRAAELFPDEIAEVKKIVEKRNLRKTLRQDEEVERKILIAYQAFIRWRKREEDDAAFLLMAEQNFVENLKSILR